MLGVEGTVGPPAFQPPVWMQRERCPPSYKGKLPLKVSLRARGESVSCKEELAGEWGLGAPPVICPLLAVVGGEARV